jgi:S1-C subfamily serine protease
VLIESADNGVRVLEVVDDSVAAAAGLRAGDVIKSAAGFATATTGELIEIIGRQAPGTWLPLEVSRDGELLTPTARFPQSFE